MDKKMKDRLFYLWMVLILGALYTENAYEKIYYLRNNVNFPHRWTVFGIILSVFIITLIAIAISNRKNKNKNEASFGLSFVIAFVATTCNQIVTRKADRIVRYAQDIDKAVSDIIVLYVTGFAIILVIAIVFDFIEKKRRDKLRAEQPGIPDGE